jgi:hypothetical protein
MFCELPDSGITSGLLGMFRAWLAGPTQPAGRYGTCTRAAAAIFDRHLRGPCPKSDGTGHNVQQPMPKHYDPYIEAVIYERFGQNF